MRDTTIRNLHSRIKWLAKIAEGEISPTEFTKQIKDVVSFCKLSIPGLFKSISLNSLKKAVESTEITPTSTHNISTWLSFKKLRKDAYNSLLRNSSTTKTETFLSVESHDLQELKDAQIFAQQCAGAYFDLISKIERHLTTPFIDQFIEREKLSFIMNQNRFLFRDVTTSKPKDLGLGLHILPGGRQ